MIKKMKSPPDGPKRKVGRPSKYHPDFCKLLIHHMTEGFSYESFAGLCGVAISSLYEWEKVNPEFSEAKKAGEAKSRLFWEKIGIEGLWHGGGKNAQFNATVWIFNMKNRFGWRDRIEQEVSQVTPFFLAYNPMQKPKDEPNTSSN